MRAVLDACVLYPTVLREVLIGVAARGLIAPIWSARLLEEWARTAARRGGAVDETFARAEIARLDAAFPNASQTHAPQDEAALWLPDSGDIHVLATAIAGHAEHIVTLNLRDFPRRELDGHGVRAGAPDAILMALWLQAPTAVESAVAEVRARAEQASGVPQPLRPLLKRARLPRLAKALDRAP